MEYIPAGGFHTLKSEIWDTMVGISSSTSFALFSDLSGVTGAASEFGCNDISMSGAGERPLVSSFQPLTPNMSHNGHGHYSHEHHDHDHDHAPEYSDSDNLYSYIDHPNVRILNAVDEAKILKPWDQRLDESVVSTNDGSTELSFTVFSTSNQMRMISCEIMSKGHCYVLTLHNRIIRVPFTGNVKIRSVLLKTGPGDQTPSKVALVSLFTL